jgi:hypothetical protein
LGSHRCALWRRFRDPRVDGVEKSLVFPPGVLPILRFYGDGSCAGGNVESTGTNGEQRLRLVLCMVGALIKPFCCSFGQFDWSVGPYSIWFGHDASATCLIWFSAPRLSHLAAWAVYSAATTFVPSNLITSCFVLGTLIVQCGTPTGIWPASCFGAGLVSTDTVRLGLGLMSGGKTPHIVW